MEALVVFCSQTGTKLGAGNRIVPTSKLDESIAVLCSFVCEVFCYTKLDAGIMVLRCSKLCQGLWYYAVQN